MVLETKPPGWMVEEARKRRKEERLADQTVHSLSFWYKQLGIEEAQVSKGGILSADRSLEQQAEFIRRRKAGIGIAEASIFALPPVEPPPVTDPLREKPIVPSIPFQPIISEGGVTLRGDETRLFKEYQRTGGPLSIQDWQTVGSPIRPLDFLDPFKTPEGLYDVDAAQRAGIPVHILQEFFEEEITPIEAPPAIEARPEDWAIAPGSFTLPSKPKTQREIKQSQVSAMGLKVSDIHQITEEEIRNTPPDIIAEHKDSWENLKRYGYTGASFETFLRHERSEKAMLATGVPANLVHDIAERIYPLGVNLQQQEAPPEITPEDLAEFTEEEIEAGFDQLLLEGRVEDAEAIFRAVGGTDEEVREVFGEVPVSLVSAGVTEGRFFKPPEEAPLGQATPKGKGFFQTIKDAWTISSVRGVETTVQAFLNIIPELLIPDPVPISERSPEQQEFYRQNPEIKAQVERQMEISQSIKDAAKQKADESLADYNRWVEEHPELAPNPKFVEGALKNPELWKDPNWWGYAFGNMAPQAATAMSAGALATIVTGGNIFAGAAAAGLTFAPLEAQGVFDDLIDEGVPREQAAELATLVTVPIVLVESASTFLQFMRFMPQIRQIFRQTATREIIKLTKKALLRKGLTTFTTLQFTEVMEEVTQQALGNTAVIMAGKDRDLFAGVPEMLPEVFAGVAPFSLFGAGVSTLTIPSSLTQPVSVPEGVREAVRDERGTVTLEPEEVEPTEPVVPPTAPLTEALITDAERIVTQAEGIQPDNASVQEMRRLVDEAKTLTGDAQRQTLIKIEALEEEVKALAPTEVGIPEVTGAEVFDALTKQVEKPNDAVRLLTDDNLKIATDYAREQVILTPRDKTFLRALEMEVLKRDISKLQAPAEVKPEVGVPKIALIKARNMRDTYSIVIKGLADAGFEATLADKLLVNVFGIRPKPTPIQGSVAFENLLTRFTNEQLVERDIRKLSLEILADELGVSTHLVDVELGRISKQRSEELVTESIKKAEQFHNTLQSALPSAKQLREFRKTQPQPTPSIAPIVEVKPEPVSTIGEEGVIIEAGGTPVSPNEAIPQGVVDSNPMLQDIGAKEKVRPSRKVLTRIGKWRELYKPIQKAEVLFNEELEVKKTLVRDLRKIAGKDKSRWVLIFREVNEKGSQVGLTFDERRVVIQIRKWADNWADKKNLPPEQRIKDYIPHLFEEEMKRQIQDEAGIDPLMASMLREKSIFRITDPFLKERLGALGFIEDPFAAMEAYDTVSLRTLHYGPLLDKIDAIMHDPNTPESVSLYLKDYSRRMTGELNTFDKSMNLTIQDFAGAIRGFPKWGEAMYQNLTTGNPSGRAAYNLTSALYVMWLGFKPTSAIRNLSQHTLIMGEVGIEHFAKGIGLRFTKEGKAVLAKSLVLRSRKFAFVEGLDSSFQSRFQKKFADRALILFREADKQNVSDAFLAGYSEGKQLIEELNKTLPDAEKLSGERMVMAAIDRGDEVAADTQYLYTKMNSPSWSQDSRGRVFSMLTTWTVNWMELMAKWIARKPSQVYLELERETGAKISQAAFSTSYQAIGLYMLIVALAYFVKENTRIKAFEYTGITSINYLAGVIGGEFPALQYPGAVANLVAGFLLDDERRMKQGWNQLDPVNMVGILRQLDDVSKGEKDWLTLLFYLEGKDIEITKLRERWQNDFKPYEDLTDPLIRAKEFPTLNQNTARKRWREENPLIEAQMFVVGRFTTLSSEKARQEVLRLIEKHKIDTELVDGYDKVFGIDTTLELSKSQKRIGNLEKLVIDEEAEYYDMGRFAEVVHSEVAKQGRGKVMRDGHPLAVELLNAEDLWKPYFDYEEAGARKLYRQRNIDVEAQLYLWGKIGAFENPESATELLRLMEKYNIPPQAINAFQQDPEKYDELFTQKFELEQKNFELDTRYENYSNPESDVWIDKAETIEVDGEEVNKLKWTRAKLKEDNPDWVANVRRIEAIDNDIPEKLNGKDATELWVERGRKVDEFGASSPEVKEHLIEHSGLHQWAIDNKLLTDDGSDWNKKVIGLDVKWKVKDDEYDAIDADAKNPETGVLLREEMLLKAINKKYNDDRRRRTIYQLDEFASGTVIEGFVEYGQVTDKFGDNSSQAKLHRFNNSQLQAFMEREEQWKELDVEKAPIWQIDSDFDKEDNQYQSILDKFEDMKEQNKAVEAYLYPNGKPTKYALKRFERIALNKGIPLTYKTAKGSPIADFVEYSTNQDLVRPADWVNKDGEELPWYEDDWWMAEHNDFYKEVYRNPDYWDKPHKKKDYRLLPTREVGAKYFTYLRITDNQAERGQYRLDNPDLDEWGSQRRPDGSVFIWSRTMSERRRRAAQTPSERFIEETREMGEEFRRGFRR